MFKVILGFILSFSITQWIYSETVLFAPSVEKVAAHAIDMITIPTHDQWRINQDSEYQALVRTEVNQFLGDLGIDSRIPKKGVRVQAVKVKPEVAPVRIVKTSSLSYEPLFSDFDPSTLKYELFS